MANVTTPTRPFDVAAHLRTPEEAAAYLSATLEEGDATAFRRALGDVARARSRAGAQQHGVRRRGERPRPREPYKALSQTENPSLDTVQRVIAAQGLTLAVVPAEKTSIVGSG